MSYPIVFFHAGTAPYVPLSLLQARHASPNSELVMLGDAGNRHLSPLARHVPQSRHDGMAAQLRKVFRNYSTNPPLFERVCLERWLCIYEWMKAEGHQRCLYMDTDVLLYSEAEPLANKIARPAGMTVAGISGHTNFIQDRAVLEKFCHYILEMYSTPSGLAFIEDEYTRFREKHRAGGISDMSFFTWFRQLNPTLVKDIGKVEDGAAFDITLDYLDEFQGYHGIKKLTWESGRPMAYTKKDRKPVLMHTLHFQGNNKEHMQEMCMAPPGRIRFWDSYNRVVYQTGRVLRRLRGKRREM